MGQFGREIQLRNQGDDRVRGLGRLMGMAPSGFTDGLNVWDRKVVESNVTSIYSSEYHKVPKGTLLMGCFTY